MYEISCISGFWRNWLWGGQTFYEISYSTLGCLCSFTRFIIWNFYWSWFCVCYCFEKIPFTTCPGWIIRIFASIEVFALRCSWRRLFRNRRAIIVSFTSRSFIVIGIRLKVSWWALLRNFSCSNWRSICIGIFPKIILWINLLCGFFWWAISKFNFILWGIVCFTSLIRLTVYGSRRIFLILKILTIHICDEIQGGSITLLSGRSIIIKEWVNSSMGIWCWYIPCERCLGSLIFILSYIDGRWNLWDWLILMVLRLFGWLFIV